MGGQQNQSALSTEPIRSAVAATVAGVPIDPTADTVKFAFPTPGVDPVDADWVAGTWEIIEAAGSTVYVAECQVGPAGAIALPVGVYLIWIKVIDNPDIPVRPIGILQIT